MASLKAKHGGQGRLSLEDCLACLEKGSFPRVSIGRISRIVQRCSKEKNSACAFRLQTYMQNNGLDCHEILGNHLVSMLVEVGSLEVAQDVFDRLTSRSESSWNSLIKGYLNRGQSRHTLRLYEEMQEDSLYPTARMYVFLLKACAQLKDVELGGRLHADIADRGLLKNDVFVGSALVDMYAKCGLLEKAREVFEVLPHEDVVLWNALISGYAKHERGEEALKCFKQMHDEGVTPNAVTLTCSLKACGIIGAIQVGEEIHEEINKQGLLRRDSVLGSALVDMYAKCGSFEKAHKVFEGLSASNIGAWNALITNYVKHNCSDEALKWFERMQLQGVSPDAISFIGTLKACGNLKALDKGQKLHAEIDKKRLLRRDHAVGSTLVDMYVKCGSILKAQEVFDELPIRTVVSWNSLLSGYVEHEHAARALSCFEQMQLEGVAPNNVTLLGGLKACGITRAADKGEEIHAEIARNGLHLKDPFVASALVDMYMKCSLLEKAHEVFDDLPMRNVVLWNALISGYANSGGDHEAIVYLAQMQDEDITPDAITLTCILKACGNMGTIAKGREIHAEIARTSLLTGDDLLGSALVDMYANCRSLAQALDVFEELPAPTLPAWNALIASHVEEECNEEALNFLEDMYAEGFFPDTVTYICCLKACGSIGIARKGKEIHAELERKGYLEKDPVVGCSLVDMYAKCGLLLRAEEVFNRLPVQDTGSWNVLVAGYANQERGEEALRCYRVMQNKGFTPDAITYSCSLKACGSMGAIDMGSEIHTEIVREGSLEMNFMVGNALVDMYVKCGCLVKARKVFDKLPHRDVASWNVIIAGYLNDEQGEEALNIVEQMKHEGVSPDAVTYTCALKAYTMVGAMDEAEELIAEAESYGFFRSDLAMGNAVVDMYAKWGLFVKAKDVLKKLLSRDVVTWNALIVGYLKHELNEETLSCLEQMRLEGISPDATTYACSLKACGNIRAVKMGKDLHAEVEREGLLEKDCIVGNALVDMYAKCGLLMKARDIFKSLPSRAVGSWNAMIAAHGSHMQGEEALGYYEEMHREGVTPNAVTLLCSLKACSSIAAYDKGRDIHVEMERQGLLEREPVIGNMVVDMYSKCGFLAAAEEVLEELPSRDVVSWSAIMAGYAQLGESPLVFDCFDRMVGEGISPNAISFVGILTACSHGGLVEEAPTYFAAMSRDYSITPTVWHYTCLVDLLGRAGHEERAMCVMVKVPFHPDMVMCSSVLGACRKWNNVELARQAFEQAVGLKETETAFYVSMYNIYADADIQGHLEVDADKEESI